MPSEEENIQYLYLVLMNGGTTTIDWVAVGDAMNLSKGAVAKRWSRLKKSIENGDKPGGTVYQFLWLCVKYAQRDKAINWNEIAEQCGTTSGAASKRYSRLKQAFEAEGGTSSGKTTSPASKTATKSTIKKQTTVTEGHDGESSSNIKRKRATAKKDMINEDTKDEDLKNTKQSQKKAKVTDPQTTSKSMAKSKQNRTMMANEDGGLHTPITETNTIIETESANALEEDNEETFIDAAEWVQDLVGANNEDQTNRVNEWLRETI